jgi:sterol desaturase/sphingolipid hydroxylase (fatty acid hydroxylase superfamily)
METSSAPTRPEDPFFRAYTDDCLDWALGLSTAKRTGRSRPRSIRVFRSTIVEEVFARAHPITPIVWFGPVIAFAGYRAMKAGPAAAAVAFALFVVGWLLWTLLEYGLHRYLFHMTAHSPRARLRAFLMHGYHHEFPDDPMRLVAPPLMSWPIAAVIALLYLLVLGPQHALSLFAGTTAGYIAYDWIHYYTHHFRPRRGLGKWLRDYHMLHHFDDGGGRFGISSPLWDWVFGTYRPLRRTQALKRT